MTEQPTSDPGAGTLSGPAGAGAPTSAGAPAVPTPEPPVSPAPIKGPVARHRAGEPPALRPFTFVYDALDRLWTRLMHGRALGLTLAIVFVLALAAIELNRLGLLPALLATHVDTRHFTAVVTVFALLLVFEVLTLVFTLPQSVANSVGRQFELVSLIFLREAFIEFGGFGEPIDVAGHRYHSLLVVLADLVGATLIFVCVGFYYRLQHHQRITPDEREQTSFIAAKKVVALSLFAGFLLIAVTAAVRYLRGRAMFDLFGDFFTLLIFADILIVLVSLAFTSGYPVVFRNAGFAAAAVLIRLALTAPPFVSVALGVGAALFAVGLTAAYNSFAPGTGEPFRPRGSVLRM
jgi:hypothetical protein